MKEGASFVLPATYGLTISPLLQLGAQISRSAILAGWGHPKKTLLATASCGVLLLPYRADRLVLVGSRFTSVNPLSKVDAMVL